MHCRPVLLFFGLCLLINIKNNIKFSILRTKPPRVRKFALYHFFQVSTSVFHVRLETPSSGRETLSSSSVIVTALALHNWPQSCSLPSLLRSVADIEPPHPNPTAVTNYHIPNDPAAQYKQIHNPQ